MASQARDESRIVLLYERACELGQGTGCAVAGMAYLGGTATPQRLERGTALLKRGCSLGEDQACGFLKRLPAGDPPAGVAGFRFGQQIGEAQKSCSNAGHEWQYSASHANHFRCSGQVVAVGFEAPVLVDTSSDGRVRELTLRRTVVGQDPRRWLTEFKNIVELVSRRYGPPTQSSNVIPAECEVRFAQCIQNKAAKVDASWYWPGASSIYVSLLASDAGGEIFVHYGVNDTTTPEGL